MIVRISGEGQYRLDDADAQQLNELENAVVGIVEGGVEDGFNEALAGLLDYVRSHGTALSDDDLEGSDVILPPGDIDFAEAGKEFTGEGLIPD
jgi:23S rRNA A2030 N6-methylase RlmJ